MITIPVNASKHYDVCIGRGILASGEGLPTEYLQGRSVMIVSDAHVYGLHGEALEAALDKAQVAHRRFVFPAGEQSKTLRVYGELLEEMCAARMTRGDVVIALGGGVVGDLAGFAAATYQRGIDIIQMPTSLLAAVDSSVGGKTGVDLVNGKNQVGAFCQPVRVVCDTGMLDSLPRGECENGCGEIVKYAMIADRELFTKLKERPVSEMYEDVIARCVAIKRDHVEKDEFDTGLRMKLNFGHTIGHAIEKCSGYTIPHGRAVAAGMAMITKASVSMGLCAPDVYDELVALLETYDLPCGTSYRVGELADAVMADKKSIGDTLTLVVPTGIGECVLKKIDKASITDWLTAGGAEA